MDVNSLDQELRKLTVEAMVQSRAKWKNRSRPEDNDGIKLDGRKFIWFMGTGGNPEATISQCPATAGFVVGTGKELLYVDPGPGASTKAAEAGLDSGLLDGIYISHGHVDHYAGVEPIIEGMCWAMSERRGCLLVPAKILDEGLVSQFHQGLGDKNYYKGGPRVVVLKPYEKVSFGRAGLTPIPVYHGGENYGFIMDIGNIRLGYTSDTNYITSFLTPDGIKEFGRWGPVMDLLQITGYRADVKETFAGVDILIANVTSHNALMHRHLTALGLAHLLKGSAVKTCLITHFGYSCVRPVDLREKMAEYIEAASGVRTLAVKDLQKHELDDLTL